jgi:hypothetical protein
LIDVYPILILSNIAAGMISRKVTQFQLDPIQSCIKLVNRIIKTIAVRAHGNNKKKLGFWGILLTVAMYILDLIFVIYNLRYFYPDSYFSNILEALNNLICAFNKHQHEKGPFSRIYIVIKSNYYLRTEKTNC